MTVVDDAGKAAPDSVRSITLPHSPAYRRQAGVEVPYYPSPCDWRHEVLYFLLVDRFSDVEDPTHPRPPLNRANLAAARPPGFGFDKWAESGGSRYQGGTIAGIESRLPYLANLGITALWISPLFKQRRHTDEYHGYAIQDFLELDPRFGTKQDLISLVAAAHKKGIRTILDIVINHSGHNWDYAGDVEDPPYKPFPGFYDRGQWIDGNGNRTPSIASNRETGVFPVELQADNCYTRAGLGSLSGDDVDDDHAEMKRTDFPGHFRDFNFDGSNALTDLSRCYKYWIALADIDGFRVDTMKHIPEDVARNFCGSIKEFADGLGKQNFFIMAEVAGPDAGANRYLDVLELNLNATLDIGSLRTSLTAVGKGLAPPSAYFNLAAWEPQLGSHSNSGPRHIGVLDDHDHVTGEKKRFSVEASSDRQVVAGVAIQLFTLCIPCIYYGTEQAFAGPEASEWKKYLPDYGSADKFLREAMFGPEHPLKAGAAGIGRAIDTNALGFGPFGTVGYSCFDEKHPAFVRIQHLIKVRQSFLALRWGRQYLRPIRNFGAPFALPPAGELIAWSRILDEEEILIVVNGHGNETRGGDVLVDGSLNGRAGVQFRVIGNSQESAGVAGAPHTIGSTVNVQRAAGGTTFVEIRNLAPSEVLILTNL